MKTFLVDLGWLEIYLQLRLGRPDALAMRRYFPAPRQRIDRIRGSILHNLGDNITSHPSP